MPGISDEKKIEIASKFLLQSPPGEFNEVFNDVRTLVNDDALLEKGCVESAQKYNKEQFVPVKLDAVESTLAMITAFNELPDGRYFDPRSKKTFSYDHLRKEASDVQSASLSDLEEKHESWRLPLQQELDDYIHEHFHRTGVASVFVAKNGLVLCIESHQFQPKNYWNGRWRSEWRLPFFDTKAGTHQVNGKLRLHIHYYEDGNVQMHSDKDVAIQFKFTHDRSSSAKDLINKILEVESSFQRSLQESNAMMSENTFRTLRRQLPVTRTKLDWIKLHSYRVAQDIKPQ